MSPRPPQDRATARDLPTVIAHRDLPCRDVDPKIFYPSGGEHGERARAVCARCRHIAECLDWALATQQRYGIWAGTSPKQRSELLKAREAA